MSAEISAPKSLHKTVKVDGLDIFYREAGRKDAPTIMLLHGSHFLADVSHPEFRGQYTLFLSLAPELWGCNTYLLSSTAQFWGQYTYLHLI